VSNPALPHGETISARISSVKSHSTGFDYLRIILATLVLFVHSKTLTLGVDVNTFKALTNTAARVGGFQIPHAPLYQPIIWAVVPAFFSLSGFLVAGSLMRSKTTAGFLALRALRIFPALIVESLLAMFVLGPLVTQFPLKAYFSDNLFFEYPLNILGDIHYFLPGVFLGNPTPGVVNAQLWTIPAEMKCYVTLACLSVLQFTRWRYTSSVFTALGVFGFSLAAVVGYYHPNYWAAGGVRVELENLLLCFMAGVAFYDLRDNVPLRIDLFVISVVLTYVFLFGGVLQFLVPVPITYATIYLGYSNFPKTIINRAGDYSYGIYLYGLPMQQTVIHFFPSNKNWLLSFLMAYVASIIFAALSWHLVEARVLGIKKPVVNFIENRLAPFSIRLPWSASPAP